mgnify:CR=1 FL=1
MLNSKTEALGIIFPNSYDAMVPELASERLMASIPFASRYRMCDFILSSMVHSGIDNISIIVRKNYHSLLDHLGAAVSGIWSAKTEAEYCSSVRTETGKGIRGTHRGT